MKTVLACILGALLLVLALGFGGWKVYGLSASVTQAQADLVQAKSANDQMQAAVQQIQADRAADALQVTALANQMQAITAGQAAKHQTLAKVVAHAKPADASLLASELPADVLRLLPGAASAPGADPDHQNVSP